MTLPTSGQISMSQVNSELSLSPTQAISLNDSAVRSLAQKTSGQISMSDLWGKSSVQVPVSYGNYVSGGPVNVSGNNYYGYIQTNLGAAGKIGSAQDLHYLGNYPVVAVISDGGSNMMFKIGGITSQPPMPYNTFRVTVGSIVYDVLTSSLIWTTDSQSNDGVIGLHYASGAPILSPVGTKFKVDFLNV